MTQHWAVVVGINQYQSLQPLLYAQQDAIALWRFLVESAGYGTERCHLLSDLAELRSPAAAAPDRRTLLTQVQQLCQQIQSDDVLWFFFSGYGICCNDRDYLLTVDTDPAYLAETACSVQELFELFKQAPTDNIVVMLDIGRAQAALADHAVGRQSLALARDFDISLILSCQPEEFSHETLAVKHGLFTAALLEGLQYHGCVSLEHIATHLRQQLPELCEHHWRPTQHPAIQIPSEKKFLLLVPPSSVSQVPAMAAQTTTAAKSPARSPQLPVVSPLPPKADTTALVHSPQSQATPAAKLPALTTLAALQRLMGSWGPIALIATLLLLILGRFDLLPLPNQTPAPNPESPRSTAPDQATEVVASGSTPPAASLETTETETTASPLFSESLSSLATTPTLSALEQGQQAIAQQRYAEAIRWLEQVSAANRDDTFNRLQERAEAGLAQQVADNQARIELARQTVQPEQAASLEAAIAQVNPIPPGEPFHQEAQQLVEQWSQSLLDLANAAANAGDLTAAIAAASFIPAAATDLYPQAQTQIGYWQARQLSQARLQQAQTMLQPGQAASFQDAIGLLRQIPAEHPEYEQAQARIDQLSQEIFSIARARAAQGRFEAAIQAAVLVPPDTAAYNGAQAQLKRWQER